MSSRPHGFDPNQKRDGRGRFAEEHGTRPTSGSLTRRPAEAWPEDAWPEFDAHDRSPGGNAPEVLDVPPARPRISTPTSDIYYGHRDKRDQALDPASWGGGRRPAESYRVASDAAKGMLETAPQRIRELVSERYPDASSVIFRSIKGDLRVVGFATDPYRPRPKVHKFDADDKEMIDEIDAINKELTVPGAKTSSHDLDGLRVDRAGIWYLPLTEHETAGPGFARASPEGVQIECSELDYDGAKLEAAADALTRPAGPISEIKNQEELMWFVRNGTVEEVGQVADSDHARAAVLHKIAMYGPREASARAVGSWQVSVATIRAVHAKTPKTAKAMSDAGLRNAAKAPVEILEEAQRPATYAKQQAAAQKRAERAAARPEPGPGPQSRRVAPAPDPRHWQRMYTQEQREYLREHMPIGFDEYGSSQADMWEDAMLSAFERHKRASRG